MQATEIIRNKSINKNRRRLLFSERSAQVSDKDLVKSKEKSGTDDRPKKSALRENVEAVVVAVILALFIRTFIVQAFKIPSGSMKETLQIGDHILVNKFIYGVKIPFLDKNLINIKNPQRGDIIVFQFPEDRDKGYFERKDFIKRTIGIAGDKIEIIDKKVYVNDQLIDTEQAVFMDSRIIPGNVQPRDNLGPITIPADSLFVMGDNRDHSYDSRFWGFVKLDEVKGKAFIIYWSWDKENFGVRWNRIGKLLE